MPTKSAGFTLVEVLVISPIIILFVGTFIALLVNLTGESLVIRERNMAIHDSQSALDDIQSSITQATGFLTTTGALQSPQGKDNSIAAFNDTTTGAPDALIVKLAATTKSPTDPTRALIYTGTGACDSKNPIYSYYAVYFVDLDPDTTDPADKALFKRTILPQISACTSPWQRGSCTASVKASNPTVCKAADEKLVGGVTTFDVKYYTGTSVAREDNAPTATDASVNLSVAKQVAGSPVDYTSSVRATSLNVQSADAGAAATPPPNPPVQWSRSDTGPDPYRTTISWSTVGNATSYVMKYRLDGGAEQTKTITPPAATTSFIDAAHRKQTVQLVDIVVNTNSGSFSYGSMPPISAIPSWNECTPISGWQNYDGTYNTQGFTKTSSGAVGLKGLIRSGIMGDTNCNLPVGFRPPNHLIFNGVAYDPAGATGNGSARIDIFPSGNVIVTGGSNTTYTNGFVSLDGIIFMASNPGWQAGSWINGWYYNGVGYGDTTYPNLDYWKDSRGRVWVQGLATGGPASVNMAWLPGNMYPSAGMHYPVSADNRGGAVNIGGAIQSRPSYGSYISTQLLYYAATGGMANLPLYNGWVSYDNGVNWTHPTCYQGTDDIVILQGLVRAGNQAAGGMTHVGVCGATPYMSTGRRALFTAWINWERQGRMDLPTDGYLYPMQSDPGWTSLDGIHYIAN